MNRLNRLAGDTFQGVRIVRGIVYCSRCGTELPDNANFCLNCGVAQRATSDTSALFEDTERELHRYDIDRSSTLLITNKRVVHEVRGFLGHRLEIRLRHSTGVEKLGSIVRIRRADGGSAKINFGKQAGAIAQSIRDAVAGP